MQKEKVGVEVAVTDDSYLQILEAMNENNKLDGSLKFCKNCHNTDDEKVGSFIITAIQLLTEKISEENEELREKQ